MKLRPELLANLSLGAYRVSPDPLVGFKGSPRGVEGGNRDEGEESGVEVQYRTGGEGEGMRSLCQTA